MKQRFFPWRLFVRWLGGQFMLAVVLSIFLISFAHRFETSSPTFTWIMLSVGMMALVSVFWTMRQLFFPLGRLLTRAKFLSQREFGQPLLLAPAQEGKPLEEPEEWSDFELELRQIERNLRRQWKRIARDSAEMETVLRAAASGIVSVDRVDRILFSNERFREFFGVPNLVPRQSRIVEIMRDPALLEAFHRTVRTGEAGTFETQVGGRDYSLSIAPLHAGGEPEPYGAVGVFHDITSLKNAERIRVDFVANVSHELRTPLTSIRGYADTLKQDLAEGKIDEAKPFLDVILRNVDRLLALVSDLLSLSALESPAGAGERLVKSPVNVRELTERVLGTFDIPFKARQLQVSARYGREVVGEGFRADIQKIEQVLTNLLDNAAKYIPVGGAITLSWEREGNEMVLRVKDNGPGIPQEHLPRLFERFYRVDPARARATGGTGLGLAIVKHVVQAHGGSVHVKSKIGHGTEFICRFSYAL